MDKRKPEDIKTHLTFESLFPINPAVLANIEQDMRQGTYDLSQPIILATWEGQEEPVCIDGHTRLRAAINIGIEEVPVWLHQFDTEQEAFEKAIKLQRNRRNITDAEIITCIEVLDKKRARGGDRRSEEEKSKASSDAIEKPPAKSSKQTGDLLGISQSKVERARTVMEHADEATKEAVSSGEKSINQAYNETQKQRKSKKTLAQNPKDSKEESASEGSWPEPVVNATTEPEKSSASKSDPATSLGKRVTVYLPDWQYNGLISLCDGYIESHVHKAVDVYVESLGIRQEEDDDDEEYFDPDNFKEDLI